MEGIRKKMSNIFFTSDWHFCHNQPFIYEKRQCIDIAHMNKELIQKHNSIVNDEDDVYVLGDLMLNDNEEAFKCISQLKGKLHLLRGNHCTDNRWSLYKTLPNVVEMLGWADVLKYKKYTFYMCHWPTKLTNFEEHNKFFCLHGHSHSSNKFENIKDSCYNVAPEAHNNFPVYIENIIKDLKSLTITL